MEERKIKLSFDDPSKPHVTLSLSRMPENCFECPLQVKYEDDEPMWGDGIGHYCPYGGETWGSAVERPKGCPLQPGLNAPVIHEVDVEVTVFDDNGNATTYRSDETEETDDDA